MIEKRFERWPIENVHPYENNPRLNDKAVADVMESIRQTADLDPIEVDENGIILSGHTRLKAYQKLKYKEVDVMVYVGLTEEQKRKYRLLANKTAEKSGWDIEKLDEELAALDFEGYDFGFADDLGIDTEEKQKGFISQVKTPQYEPTGRNVEIEDCIDTSKTNELILEIEAAKVPQDVKEFLIAAAYRHAVINYKNVAEYYANAPAEIQRLMEKSALVIIDVNDAIANGYIRLIDTLHDAFMGDADED